MKHIVAINASPRLTHNTASLVKKAAEGAASQGAQVTTYDLYRLAPFTGCVSCFGCKRKGHLGQCIHQDGLTPILNEIEEADGLILGTPNYLGDATAAFRALYERLVFSAITYQRDRRSYRDPVKSVLLIMTSNVPESDYDALGYTAMLRRYQNNLNGRVGPTEVMIYGDTLQVSDYSQFTWTAFDADAKQARHETAFPQALKKAYDMGANLV